MKKASKYGALALFLMTTLFMPMSFGFLKDYRKTLSAQLLVEAVTLDPEVLTYAITAYQKARASGKINNPYLTVIDYSKPSSEKRMWVFNMNTKKMVIHTWVAHGSGTGLHEAKHFSNVPGSHKSSLGAFITGETYQGKHGTSLVLHGQEQGINHNAATRRVVIHGAPYVSEDFIATHGRLGRSWGCPAVSFKISDRLIHTIKQGSLVFSYYPNTTWLSSSRFVK